MTAAAQPGSAGGGRGPERLAILGATGGVGGHLLSWFMITALTTDGYLLQAPAICW